MESLIINLILAGLRALYKLITNDPNVKIGLEADEQGASSDDQRVALGGAVMRSVSMLKDLEERAVVLRAQLQEIPQHQILVEALDNRVMPDFEMVRQQLAASEPYFANQVLQLIRLRLQVLSELLSLRKRPETGEYLADAEALVDAFMSPFAALSRTESFAFAQQKPLCVPADPDHEALWMGLLPGYPLVFVPRDFGRNIYRWASLPHEIGHLVFRSAPGFEEEVRDRLDLDYAPMLFDLNLGGSFELRAAYSAWLEEMVADMFAMLTLGPAGLRGMVESFKSPHRPEEVQWAAADGQQYAPHPPAHLRVLLASKLLDHVGFDIEAKPLIRRWTELHGEPDALFLPALPAGGLSVPTPMMVQAGWEIVLGLYQTSFESMAGREFRSIHGFELSPGEWSRAQGYAVDIGNGHAVGSDHPRAVLIAAIEAFAAHPGQAQRIAAAVRHSIIGRGSDERRPADIHYQQRRRRRRTETTADDVRAALVLHEILAPPSRRSRNRSLIR